MPVLMAILKRVLIVDGQMAVWSIWHKLLHCQMGTTMVLGNNLKVLNLPPCWRLEMVPMMGLEPGSFLPQTFNPHQSQWHILSRSGAKDSIVSARPLRLRKSLPSILLSKHHRYAPIARPSQCYFLCLEYSSWDICLSCSHTSFRSLLKCHLLF